MPFFSHSFLFGVDAYLPVLAAVVYALGMAADTPGSKVVVCTDGLANEGLGSVESATNEQGKKALRETYERIGRIAKENGTVINVISIRGDDCRLEYLGILADITSGVVDIVDPLDLSKQVANIVSKKVLATGLTCKLWVPSTFAFHDTGSMRATKEIGNCTADTDITAAFKLANPSNEKVPDMVPVQAQLVFSRPDGAKVVRVLTKMVPVSRNRSEVEGQMETSIAALRSVQFAASLAQQGDYESARTTLISTQRLLQRGMKTAKNQREYINFIVQAERLDGFMRQAQAQAQVLNNLNQDKDDSAAKNIVMMKQASHSQFVENVGA